MAKLASVITNIARTIWGKEGVEMTAPIDFIPKWDKEDDGGEKQVELSQIEPKRQTIPQMKQVLHQIVKAYKDKKVKTKKRKV